MKLLPFPAYVYGGAACAGFHGLAPRARGVLGS
jgi:hypothetical protein